MAKDTMPTIQQKKAVLDLGVTQTQLDDFFQGKQVVYDLPTEHDPGVAIVQWTPTLLRCGVVEITDRGGGLVSLLRFRQRSLHLARCLGLPTIEMLGIAVANKKLEQILVRQGFQRKQELCPDELGNAMVEVLSRIYPTKD